jgi:DNA ligase-associated metallophosphoesterase
MNHTRTELAPGLVLDARRAAYLAEERVLAVADLHLGYAWTHRARGQILPLSAPDDTLPRLQALLDDYQPRSLVLLGDIVHGPAPVAEFRAELLTILAQLRERAELVLIAGNHDRHLTHLAGTALVREHRAGPHLLLHGDTPDEAAAAAHLATVRTAGGRLIMGHEHPAIVVSDRVANSARVPCFLAADDLLVLPAFSRWAAGSNARYGEWLSAYPKLAAPSKAFAILAGKLLPVSLGR